MIPGLIFLFHFFVNKIYFRKEADVVPEVTDNEPDEIVDD